MQDPQHPPPPPPTVTSGVRPQLQPPDPDNGPSLAARFRPQLSAAGWLAATGATLLLLASVVVVASQWESITPEIRFSGLVAALLAIYFAAEAGRAKFPTTSTAMATLAASMTAPVAIAAAASISQPWPVCVFAGGIAAVAAAEVQSRRWKVPLLKAATVVAAGLASVGLAALTGAPVALIGAGAAVVALTLGAWRRSVVLSVAVGFTPMLVSLSNVGIGPGTLARIGATGDVLTWSAPVSAAIAAIVIGTAAHRRREIALTAAAATTLLSGVFVGMMQGDVGPVAWWCIPALALIAFEVVALLETRSVWGTAATRLNRFVVMPVALGGFLSPLIVVIARATNDFGDVAWSTAWALPIALTAGALAVATVGSSRRSASNEAFIATFVSAASAAVAVAFASGSEVSGWSLVGVLGGLVVATAVISRWKSANWAHSSAVLLVATACAALVVGAVGLDSAVLLLIALTATTTGLAFLKPKFTPVDTAALTAGALLLLVGFASSPALCSLAMITVSSQALMYTLARRERNLTLVAAAGTAASLLSLWWTSGTNDFVIEQLQPFGADGADLALAAISLTLLIGGGLIRRVQPVSTWLAYSPGLGMAAAWLLSSQIEQNTLWATVMALAVGVIATGIGGFHRLGAPLIIGTGLIAATLAISAGPQLAEAPTWIWIAASGVGLLVLAALIERSDKPLIAVGSRSDESSVLQQFCEDFD